MKKYLFFSLIFVISLMTSCSIYGTFRSFEDDFTNRKTFILEQNIHNSDYTNINSANIYYQRVISRIDENVRFYFAINRSTNSFPIADNGMMKAGEEIYDLDIFWEATEQKMRNEITTRTKTESDSTSTVTKQRTDVKSHEWFEDKFYIDVTPSMVKSIMQSDTLVFRFYFGPMQATYKLHAKELINLKKLFTKE